MIKTTISPDVLDVLKRSTIAGNVLTLPAQLDRPMYEAVNKVIANCGGKWKRGTGHVFTNDPREKLGLAIESGETVNEQQLFQSFYTPAALAAEVVSRAGVSGFGVFEPSCGAGALVKECLAQGAIHVFAVDINPEAIAEARKNIGADKRALIEDGDFLRMMGSMRFDRIVMNPPFSKGQDVKHVLHALKFLKDDGRLVAIVSGGPRTEEALQPIAESWEEIPAGTFKESGTGVRTILATFTKG